MIRDEPKWVSSLEVNGERREASFPVSLEAFIESLGMIPSSVVVELNKEAVTPSSFSEIQLSDGDRLEIIKIVAGG